MTSPLADVVTARPDLALLGFPSFSRLSPMSVEGDIGRFLVAASQADDYFVNQ